MSIVSASSAAPITATKLEPDSRMQTGRAPTSRLARSDRTLLDRDDTERIPVLVKLDHDAVASYTGGVPGFAATSPAVTGRRLSAGQAERDYEAYLAKREDSFTTALAARIPAARVKQSLRTVYGGLAVTLPANRVKELLAMDAVVAVQRDELREPLTDSSGAFIGADRVPGLPTGADGAKQAGQGVIVGVLDTGAWPEHPSFADQGNLNAPPAKADGTARTCDFGDNPQTKAEDVFDCNHKLIGGSPFLSSYLSVYPDDRYHSARDSNGHGTHTGSTTAGNVLSSAKVFGVERGPTAGIAPGAWVSVYKVCGMQGCFSSDSAAAVAQAVRDGVDVINFSISGGTNPFIDPVEMAFLDAYAAGVFVAASAGNSGPQAGTVNHLSPWVTTVAASTQPREFAAELTLTAGGQTKTLRGASITAGAGPAPVVRADAVKAYAGGALCDKPAKAGIFTGKIVVCERGSNARVEKGWNVSRGGAVGMILYNPTLQDVETDNHWLPTVHLADGAVATYLKSHPGVTATIGASHADRGKGDVMAAFSSRGPAGLALKPDVTAPGVQILAGHTPTPEETTGGPVGELFQAIAGTSMSSPHVAGAAALLAARHPQWSPGQLKSALMTTARTDVLKEDVRTKADPLDLGAGRIVVDRAADPGLTISETAERMLALADDEVKAVDLNLPSISAPIMPGRLSTTRTVHNVTGQSRRYMVSTNAPGQSAISVSPSSFTVPPHGDVTLRITIYSRAVTDDFLFDEIRLVPASGYGPALHLPVAFRPTQGKVTLTSACTPKSVEVGRTGECTVTARNTGYEDSSVGLRTEFDQQLKPISVRDRSTGSKPTGPQQPGPQQPGPQLAGSRVVKHAGLRGIQPGTPSLSDLDDRFWWPLADHGVTADPISDEEIVNYSVPSFRFAGQSYDQLGVASNGYLVVGGGTIQDVRSEPPSGVEVTRPNNLLAPYWADLDGSKDDGLRLAHVSRGGQEWIAVEWRVKNYGTQDSQHFQVWLATGDTEQVRFAYDPAKPPSGAKAFAVGGENALGQGVLQATPVGSDLGVRSEGGHPGGVASYTVVVRGLVPADATVTTTMASPDVPGTTVVRSKIAVVRSRP